MGFDGAYRGYMDIVSAVNLPLEDAICPLLLNGGQCFRAVAFFFFYTDRTMQVDFVSRAGRTVINRIAPACRHGLNLSH